MEGRKDSRIRGGNSLAMRIALCGSIGVGKTTIIDHLVKEPIFKKYAVYKEISLPLEGERGSFGWTRRFQILLEAIHSQHNVIADRCFVDRLAWEIMRPCKQGSDHLIMRAVESLLEYRHGYLFYVPIEFELQNDPSRKDRDLALRETFDQKIKACLDFFNLPFTPLSGTVEARCKQVLARLGDYS